MAMSRPRPDNLTLRRAVRDHRAVLQQALRAHQADDLDTAERLYREVLELHAAQPDALHYLGVLCHQRGRSDEAVELIRTALKITPRHPDAHNNLGNIHKECDRPAEAEACYRRALECSAGHHNALGNLAVVLEVQSRLDEAFEAYGSLLQQAPDDARGHYLMGLFLRSHAQHMEHLEQAAECFGRAFELDPRNLRALEALGVTLYALQRRDEARGVYRDWLAREPDNPVPRHMLAACGGAEAPPRAADDYVRELFDGFADSFDEQLLKNLDYRAPQVLVEALAERLDAPAAALDVLDAGCGTGLCAPLLRPYARHLAGVDLSGGMVEKARARGGYDVLEVAELTGYLQARRAAWHLVVSADTLVYFGQLQEALVATYGALRPGGWLGFTLEALDEEADRVELTPSGRYRHTRRYVERVVAAAGFDDVRITTDTLRREAGQAVAGWVVMAQRPGPVTPVGDGDAA
ncbi:Predicted methyltransferase, contains TPR repeat [Frateuria terrea]|uniref:Predicted methyltransferase, contains TPR repeat n=2 Tax=Frateuria terrea TaxID=529704 RepID=A0A1H6QCV7_9GAMM|nr:Predicted methyltransferase, contains TPR repeat [Frateuria terrea]SFP06915.1 Predicted methyltransferase, contains TPR repeat [Frateuria terrea]